MHLFYLPHLDADQPVLDQQESKHCIKVLRLMEGDIIHLTDGRGFLYKTVITDPNPMKCRVRIIEKRKKINDRGFSIHIAVAPTKSINRFEWFLEKATEIGIDKITPVICDHSERKSMNTERAEKVMINAIKQSLHFFLPLLAQPVPFCDFIEKCSSAQKFIACYDPSNDMLKSRIEKGKDSLVLIGPEGDFSKNELTAALHKGFLPINLGGSRLRTETAALIACHTIHIMNQ